MKTNRRISNSALLPRTTPRHRFASAPGWALLLLLAIGPLLKAVAALTNDQCAGAVPLSFNTFSSPLEYQMRTSSATETGDPTPACQPNFGRGVWFTVTSPNQNGVVVLRTCASSFDTVVQAYSGSCGALTPLACNNDTGVVCSPPARASVFFPVVAGQTYPLLVGGLGGAGGSLELQARFAEFFPVAATAGTEIAISNGVETVSATISFTFHDSCGSVKSWGVPVQNGTNVVVDIQSIHYVGVGCLAVLEPQSHTYELGSLAPGDYMFQWKNFGVPIMSVPFTVLPPTHTYTPYAVANFAGLPGVSGTNDATGSAARFNFPSGTAVDSTGIVYVADTDNHTIRKITPAGVATTLAGSAGQGGSTDGTGSAARFLFPAGVAVDRAGNVYVADGSFTIRKITPAGQVTTLAGSAGQQGSTNGTGSAARFNSPSGVAVDSGTNVYVADTENQMIRKLTPVGTN